MIRMYLFLSVLFFFFSLILNEILQNTSNTKTKTFQDKATNTLVPFLSEESSSLHCQQYVVPIEKITFTFDLVFNANMQLS